MPRIENSLTEQIVTYVRNHPGASRADIIKGIGFTGPSLQITTMLGRLKREHALRSEGPYPKLNRWFPIKTTDNQKYQEIASDILAELKDVHHTAQQDYLARRLQEIFEQESASC